MIAEVLRYPLFMDQFAVDAGPDNVTSRTHYPFAKLGILTWVLRTITKYTHLSLEMTGIVGAIFSFWQPLRFAQALSSLEFLRKFFLGSFHFLLSSLLANLRNRLNSRLCVNLWICHTLRFRGAMITVNSLLPVQLLIYIMTFISI
jgi:hypothetical protein